MALLQDVIDSIRGGTDHDTDTQVTDVTLTLWINEEYPVLVRRLASAIPDRYTKYSSDVTVVSGASSFDVTANPPNVSDLSKLLCPQLKQSGRYLDLPLARTVNAENAGCLCFRQRGASTVDLFPAEVAPNTYRIKYVYKPAKLTSVTPGVTDVLDLPDGGEGPIVQVVSARVRGKFDEDPSAHERWRETAWREFRDSMLPFYSTTPRTVTDVTGRY